MPGAGNTDACLHPRCVPGLASLVGASSTSSSSVYACPVLATPVRAFVHDVSPGLANPQRRVVNIIYFLAHHYFDTTAPMLTRRHRLPRLDIDHDILRTATSTTAPPPTLSATSTNDTKGYRLLEQPRWFSLQPRLRDASTVTTVGGVRRLAFGFFSSLTVCVATVVTAGGC